MRNFESVHAREILHCGEGPPGPVRKLTHIVGWDNLADAAEFFVSEMVDKDMRNQNAGNDQLGVWDGCQYVVEVKPIDNFNWVRYRVGTRVKLDFEVCCEPCEPAAKRG